MNKQRSPFGRTAVRWLVAAAMLAAPFTPTWADEAAPGGAPPAAPADPAATQTPAAKTTTTITATEEKPRLDIYGAAMLDMGYQTKQSDPDWFDVMRVTKLPAFKDQFGADGHFYAGVRQSRFGVKGFAPTDLGELKTIFEFELFGTGVDAGQTTFRLRHAWGELGQIGAGQYWSPFMDPDVFPNSIEYWGPTGMVLFRNVQFRWTPWQKGDSRFAIALERPGASADQGIYAGRIELANVKARFPLPDLSAHFRKAGDWGHVQLGGILRQIKYDDLNTTDRFELSGDATGWGVNLSSNLKFTEKKHTARLQVVVGAGIQNYMNDAPVDVGIKNQLTNPVTPIVGEALGLVGIVAYMDLNWNAKWTSTVGYSYLDIDNSTGQSANAFKTGQYASANLLYHPTADFFLGPEIIYGKRENFRDRFTSDDVRIQFSARYGFKHTVGGK